MRDAVRACINKPGGDENGDNGQLKLKKNTANLEKFPCESRTRLTTLDDALQSEFPDAGWHTRPISAMKMDVEATPRNPLTSSAIEGGRKRV